MKGKIIYTTVFSSITVTKYLAVRYHVSFITCPVPCVNIVYLSSHIVLYVQLETLFMMNDSIQEKKSIIRYTSYYFLEFQVNRVVFGSATNYHEPFLNPAQLNPTKT